MKVLTGNITTCACGRSLEYDKGDIIPAIECPECGKLLKVSGVASTVTNKLEAMSWVEVIKTPAKELMLGATKSITLKNGETYVLQVVDRRDGLVVGLKDLYGTDENGGRAINEEKDYDRSYKDSNIRKWLNNEFYDLLPDDFKEVLAVANVQSGGEILQDKVFIPSETEYRGALEYGECEEGEQFELYKDWHNRIAGYPDGDYGRWHWHRTKASKKYASAGCFCHCDGGGYADCDNATHAAGVRPHFLLKSLTN